MALNPATTLVGDIVRYEDMANPGSDYVVIGVEPSNPWGTFRLVSVDDYNHEATDGRQAGWTTIKTEATK